MPKTFILTFIANDRPGLVDLMSEVVHDHGGNWLESKMAHLAEKFAGIVRVQAPDSKAEAMADALSGLSDHGFRLRVEEARVSVPTPPGRQLRLELVGQDHPGIVNEITKCLADHKVSVEEMETYVDDAPFAGGKLFTAVLVVLLPSQLSEDTLASALEEIGGSVMVDISLEDAVA